MNFLVRAAQILSDSAQWGGEGGFAIRILEHGLLSLCAVVVAVLVGLPLGVISAHIPGGSLFVGTLSGAARALPVLGLVVIAGLWFGVGLLAPCVVLVVLALPSIINAGYSAVEATPREIRSAATAIGFSRRQLILHVIFPYSGGIIWGGIRTASLQVFATATLVAYTADIGLGSPIFMGLKTRNYPLMLAAAIVMILLTWGIDVVLAHIQKRNSFSSRG
ncbi:ABC transporter permease subunit [Corynebacterium poyangense]|uniref:ABC transporter permease subunit n=1 Tax=Corynebacterium poyangense TaxID=2684405 RepID=A0A7H0SMX5_9CORY|nr:ABC transporter permease subunit [Corynebacterium poyangense]MBZ8176268.1 ABC transporter permease subunit [Corynebacterium poyangense]QNQ89900.1 ABC transporter permease subunit [Corynebacterium poyangense]